MLTVQQVAEQFQVSDKTVYRAIHRGELRAAKIGSEWRIRQADADAWFERCIPEFAPSVLPPPAQRRGPARGRRGKGRLTALVSSEGGAG